MPLIPLIRFVRAGQGLLVLLLASAACDRPAQPPPNDIEAQPADVELPLIGQWRLDAETQEWLPRACVVLDIENTDQASMQVLQVGEEMLVRLNDARETTFAGPVRRVSFSGRQILPTTATGRFCGAEILVTLRLRLVRGRPDKLEGIWQTPGCGVCPDRRFGAERIAG